MKNIIILGAAYPFRGGGITSFNELLAKELKQQGFNIIIYNFTILYPKILFPGKFLLSEESNPLPSNIPNLRKVNSINPFNWLKIGYELFKMKPDIVIFRYWLSFMAPCYMVISFITGLNKTTKILAIVDNAIPHEPKFFDIPFAKLFFKTCHKFVAMSQKVVQDMARLSSNPCKFLYHPMYENYGKPIKKEGARMFFNLEKNEKIILFFGFIREYKGLEILMEAMSDERIKQQNVKLIVAGEFYVDSQKYFDLARSLEIEDNIIWKNNFIPDSEVVNYFCSADAVVLPYKSATQSGITQIAYYYQTPIIATNVGGLSEVVPHNKVGLITQSNSKSISEAINLFYQNDLYSKFHDNMKEERKKFTWEYFVKSLMSNI